MKKIRFSLEKLEPYFEKVAGLSKLYRILILVGTLIALIGPFVYFSFLPKHQQIDALTAQLEDLQRQLVIARQKAAELPKVQKAIQEAQVEFNIAKKALPESEEIPSLLTSISYSGQDAGMEFLLFQPEVEKAKGFYAEIPVSINVKGTYHSLVKFYDQVSRLNRIVNMKNVRITFMTGKDINNLNVLCTAVTYRFLEGGK